MTDARPYPSSALREAQEKREAATGDAMAASLGPEFASTHLGGSDEVDCIITKNGATFAVVEITADVDEDFQRDLSFSYDNPDEVIRNLPRGYGEWAIQLAPGTRLNALGDAFFLDLIHDLMESGRTDIDRQEILLGNDSRLLHYVEAGMQFVFKMPMSQEDRAQVMFGQRPDSIVISSDQNLYADYLDELLTKRSIRGKIDRLIDRRDDSPAWFAIVVGSGSPNSVRFRTRGASYDPGLPNRVVTIPSGLEYIWILNEDLAPQFVVDADGTFLAIEETDT
jgi:hypothetical protein